MLNQHFIFLHEHLGLRFGRTFKQQRKGSGTMETNRTSEVLFLLYPDFTKYLGCGGRMASASTDGREVSSVAHRRAAFSRFRKEWMGQMLLRPEPTAERVINFLALVERAPQRKHTGAQWIESIGEVRPNLETLTAQNADYTKIWGSESGFNSFLVKFSSESTP